MDIEKELKQANERIKRLEEESESNWKLAESAIGSCADMSSRIKQLEQALESIIKQVPAQDGGGFFCLRFDGEGNEIGVEYIDPMTIVSKMYSIAIEAIEINKTKL
jgi:hypothetical protein